MHGSVLLNAEYLPGRLYPLRLSDGLLGEPAKSIHHQGTWATFSFCSLRPWHLLLTSRRFLLPFVTVWDSRAPRGSSSSSCFCLEDGRRGSGSKSGSARCFNYTAEWLKTILFPRHDELCWAQVGMGWVFVNCVTTGYKFCYLHWQAVLSVGCNVMFIYKLHYTTKCKKLKFFMVKILSGTLFKVHIDG